MKKHIVCATLILLTALSAAAQRAIKANRAQYHIGEDVVVVDSITSVRVLNDSTTLVGLGNGNEKSARLTLILKFPSTKKPDSDLLNSLNNALLEVRGKLSLAANGPSISVNHKQNLFFFSAAVKQKWALISERAGNRVE